MKRKTIKKILDAKFESFVKSIKDEKVQDLVRNGTIITGGCITSMLLNEDVNDFDLYFKDLDTTKVVAEYYVKQFKENKSDRESNKKCSKMTVTVKDGRVRVMIKSSGIESETTDNEDYEYFESIDPSESNQTEFIENALEFYKDKNTSKRGEYKPIFLTSNAITLSNNIQLVLRFYGNAEEIHRNYDFIHCTNYWTSWDKQVILNADALESILSKTLIYQGSLYPICSLIRIRKFIKRGWNISAGEIFKMAWQVSQLDLTDTEILSDQLVGVDAAYFRELVFLLQDARKNGKDINTNYVMELVNEIF